MIHTLTNKMRQMMINYKKITLLAILELNRGITWSERNAGWTRQGVGVDREVK